MGCTAGLQKISTPTVITSPQMVCIWAEENGPIAANQNEWSYGNGAVGIIGVPLPFNWRLVAVGFNADVFDAGSTATIGIQDNSGGATQTVYSFVVDAPDVSIELANPVDLTPGMTLGFRTLAVTGGTKSDYRVSAWIERIV